MQYEINVQVGKFLKNIKRAGQNRRAGGKNFWTINKRAGGKFILLNKIDFPAPNKEIEKVISNEKLKIVK